MDSAPPITVWLIEDNAVFRRAVSRAIDRTAGFACTGEFSSCEDARAALARRSPPRVLLLDVVLPGQDGISALAPLRDAMPGTAILILTVFDDDQKILRAICAGAAGYLLKTSPLDEITRAIREVLDGGAPMNARIARRVLEMFSRLAPSVPKDYGLTSREIEILQLMVAGHIKKEIADRMTLSIHTVDSHMRHIYEKLQVTTGTGAVAKALKEHIV